MTLSIRVNEECLVRHQDCKRIFGGSRICFVACPNSDKIALELEIIRQKLREVNIEPYVAIDEREFQKDIFCEKICTKIIESQFCITVLNDVKDTQDGINKPNANVYYEYGLMTAFRKKNIPIQLDGQNLAFNIQSLDTLKYNRKDFASQIEDAIRLTLLGIDEDQKKKQRRYDESNIEWSIDLMGLVRVDERYRFRHERTISSRSLGFQPFLKPTEQQLFFVGIFRPEAKDRDVILRSKMLTIRIKNYCDQIKADLLEFKEQLSPRPRSIINDRITENEKILSQLTESNLLIIKENIDNSKEFISSYKESVKNQGFTLNMKILDDKKVKQLMGP
jgi:hypothetical protein